MSEEKKRKQKLWLQWEKLNSQVSSQSWVCEVDLSCGQLALGSRIAM